MRWISDTNRLHGVAGAPDVNPATGVVTATGLRIEPGWGKFRWVDARHLRGAGGQPGVSFAWSHTKQGPQPEPGRRLIGVTLAGWNDVWCDVTDAGGTRRYTARTLHLTHDYEVQAPPTQDLLADGTDGYLTWYPHTLQDPTGPVGQGLPMTVRILPVTVPGIAAPPAMTAGPGVPGFEGVTRSFDVPAAAAGTKQYLSFKYVKPSSVPAEGLVWAWEPAVTFPGRPELGEIRWATVWHRFVPAVGQPAGTSLAVRTPFPPGHFSRSDPSKIPLAGASDFTGAPTQAQAVARFVDLLSTKPLWVDAGDNAGTPIYNIPDVTQVPVQDIRWSNAQNVEGSSGVGDGQHIVLGMPIPKGAIASAGTDRNYMAVAPNQDGGTDYSTWMTSQRYGNTEPYGRPVAGGVTPSTPQHQWWATTGGKTPGLSTSTSGRLAAGHNSSVSRLTVWGMILTVDEAQAAFAAYHPTNQAAWDTIIDHHIYMLSTRYKWTRLSWPSGGSDGTTTNEHDLANGQIVSIHPDLNLTSLNWAGKKLGHIIARAIQRCGLILADTCGGGGTNIACQSGITYRMANGTSPWTTLREGNGNGSHLTPIPTTFVHPVTSVVTQTWRVHRVITSEADWNALNV